MSVVDPRGIVCSGHQKKLMLAVDRLRKSVSSGCGLRRQSSTTTTWTPPRVEPRTSSLAVSRPSNARSATVNPATPGRDRDAQPAATANEIIHLRDDPVVVRPEMVAIHVSRGPSSTWVTAADDDNDIGGGVASSLTYESFRGPPPMTHQPSPLAAVDAVPDRRGRAGTADDGEKTPTNEVAEASSSPRHNRGDVFAVSATDATSSPTKTSQAPSVASLSSSARVVAVTTSPTTTTTQMQTSQVPAVTSPSSSRPRPLVAPKPRRLELQQRRASAGESTTTDGNDKGVAGVASPTTEPQNCKTSSPASPPLSSTPGLAALASVMAAASSQRMSERCGRLPPSPSPRQQAAADVQVDGKTAVVHHSSCARPNSASALASRTASNSSGGGSDIISAGCSRTLRREHSSGTGTSSLTSVGADDKARGTADDRAAKMSTASPVRTASMGDSPRRTTAPPPVPPKHTHSFRVEKRSADAAVVARSSSSSSPAAATPLPGLSAASLHGSGDTGTLPFANENVGTIRQRGNSVSTEQPAASTTSVNVDVTNCPGDVLISAACLSLSIQLLFISSLSVAYV